MGIYLLIGFLGHLTTICLTFRETATVFQSGSTIFHSHQQCTSSNFSILSWTLIVVFLIIDILMGMKWYLTVVLICISLMTNDVEHLIMCSFPICITSLEKCPLGAFAHFKTGYLSFYYWIVKVLSILWIYIPYHIGDLQIYSPILWVVFLLSWWSPLQDITRHFDISSVGFTL